MEEKIKQSQLPPKLQFASAADIKNALGTSIYYSILSDIEHRTGKKATFGQLKKEIFKVEPYFKKFDSNEKFQEKIGQRFLNIWLFQRDNSKAALQLDSNQKTMNTVVSATMMKTNIMRSSVQLFRKMLFGRRSTQRQ
jgi:hypothetical protein